MHTTTQHSTDSAEDFLLRRSRSLALSSLHQVQATGEQQREEGWRFPSVNWSPTPFLPFGKRSEGCFPSPRQCPTTGLRALVSARSVPAHGGERHTEHPGASLPRVGTCPWGQPRCKKTLVKPRRGIGFAHHPTPGAPAGLCRAWERGAPGRVPAVSAARPACVARGSGSGCRRRRGGLGRGPGQGFLSPPPPSSPRRRFP